MTKNIRQLALNFRAKFRSESPQKLLVQNENITKRTHSLEASRVRGLFAKRASGRSPFSTLKQEGIRKKDVKYDKTNPFARSVEGPWSISPMVDFPIICSDIIAY